MCKDSWQECRNIPVLYIRRNAWLRTTWSLIGYEGDVQKTVGLFRNMEIYLLSLFPSLFISFLLYVSFILSSPSFSLLLHFVFLLFPLLSFFDFLFLFLSFSSHFPLPTFLPFIFVSSSFELANSTTSHRSTNWATRWRPLLPYAFMV
jgi:hypothetical protein